MQPATRSRLITVRIASRLHCENCELPLAFGAIRKVGGVDSHDDPAVPSCLAPKLCPNSCAITRSSQIVPLKLLLIETPSDCSHSESRNAMPMVVPSSRLP